MAQTAKLGSQSNDELAKSRLSEKPFPAAIFQTGRGGLTHTSTRKFSKPTAQASLAASQREGHLHLRVHFDRFSVQQVRLVLPLLHRLDRGRSQHRVTANQLQVLDVARLADLRLQDHRS